jgi:hypothetical protein
MALTLINYYALVITSILHPFYVSVCEVYHNPKSDALEISLKVFIDDIELAIQKSGENSFKISENSEKERIENGMEKYLEDRFVIEIDSKKKNMEVIGYELENDAIVFYIEIKNVKRINQIKLRNSIISEVRDGQINLTHFQYREQLKSFKTTGENPEGSIDVSKW